MVDPDTGPGRARERAPENVPTLEWIYTRSCADSWPEVRRTGLKCCMARSRARSDRRRFRTGYRAYVPHKWRPQTSGLPTPLASVTDLR